MTIQGIVHAERGAHLATGGQNPKSYDGDGPVGLVVVREAEHEGAEKGQDCSDGAGRETHLWLADAVVPFRVEIGDSVGHGAAEVGANEGPHEWR